MIEIQSIDDPRVAEFLSLKDKSLRDNGLLIAETHKVVSKLIQKKHQVDKLFCSTQYYNENTELLSSVGEVYTADKSLLEKVVGFNLHHGVMAIAKRPSDIKLSDIDDKVIILNGLTSPENVGKIVRSACAFGVKTIIVDEKTCSPFLRRAVRVSMGNIFEMNVYHSKNIRRDLETISDSHKIYLTANEERAVEIKKADFTGKTSIVIGSEGHGIDKDILFNEEFIVTKIPIDPFVMHLNASVAASIYLYELSCS